MADKIDQLKIGNTAYDIDLPPDATPSIASLTVAGDISEGGTSLADKYYIKPSTGIPASDLEDSYVTSVNGSSGAITNVAKTNVENVFTTAQTMHGRLDLTTSDNGRATIHLITATNDPNDFYFGSNGTKHWSLTSRASNESNCFCLYDAISTDYVFTIPSNNIGMDFYRSLNIFSDGGNFNEGIRLHPSNGWSGVVFCENSNSGNSGTSAKTWSIHNNEGNFGLYRNGSTPDSASMYISNLGGDWILKGSTKSGVIATTSDIPADTNYYPIRSYTSGLQISSYSGSTDCQLYVPYATTSQIGVQRIAAGTGISRSYSSGVCTISSTVTSGTKLYKHTLTGITGTITSSYTINKIMLICTKSTAFSALNQAAGLGNYTTIWAVTYGTNSDKSCYVLGMNRIYTGSESIMAAVLFSTGTSNLDIYNVRITVSGTFTDSVSAL